MFTVTGEWIERNAWDRQRETSGETGMSHSASQQQEMVRASITQQTHMDASTKVRAHTHWRKCRSKWASSTTKVVINKVPIREKYSKLLTQSMKARNLKEISTWYRWVCVSQLYNPILERKVGFYTPHTHAHTHAHTNLFYIDWKLL